ncbi:hypothetical protein GUJ93_ZPchr0006g40956 [Zizania palustris]|uniref:Uncharacterized protein n=1 Tax=Zizania palustris TaxID=103762 RepID=A0A8J5SM78_ZIZPA|nr:hypothetical protein GUJ93_ZPchr0006g40956 [Zizania palustris]
MKLLNGRTLVMKRIGLRGTMIALAAEWLWQMELAWSVGLDRVVRTLWRTSLRHPEKLEAEARRLSSGLAEASDEQLYLVSFSYGSVTT